MISLPTLTAALATLRPPLPTLRCSFLGGFVAFRAATLAASFLRRRRPWPCSGIAGRELLDRGKRPGGLRGRHGGRVAGEPDDERLRECTAVGIDRLVEDVLGIGDDLDAGIADAAERHAGRQSDGELRASG